MQNIRKQKLTKVVLAALVGVSIMTTSLPKAEADFDVGSAIGAVLGVGIQYAQLNKQIAYYNSNEGRNKYMGDVKKQVGVNYDPTANAMLDRVMSRLSSAIAVDDPSIKKQPYNHFVNDQKTFNAFCTLGHNMSVNIGLFDILNYNEDELAFVVAHEMGHGQHNDPANGVKRTFPLSVLAAVASSQAGNIAEVIGVNILNNLGSAKLVTLPMEKKADEFAFDYAPKAGYNPGAGSAVWQRVIDKMGAGNKQSFVGSIFNPSDHPGNISRRDTYSKDITAYSNNNVKVDGKTAVISVKNKAIGAPKAGASMSALERAYLIAGNISTVYHDKLVTNPTASSDDSYVYLNDKAIMSLNSGDDADTWVTNLNLANRKKSDTSLTSKAVKTENATKTIKKNTKTTATTTAPGSFRAKVEAERAAKAKAAANK